MQRDRQCCIVLEIDDGFARVQPWWKFSGAREIWVRVEELEWVSPDDALVRTRLWSSPFAE